MAHSSKVSSTTTNSQNRAGSSFIRMVQSIKAKSSMAKEKEKVSSPLKTAVSTKDHLRMTCKTERASTPVTMGNSTMGTSKRGRRLDLGKASRSI